MALIRYRRGIDDRTGKWLVGWPHCQQSIREILLTQLEERVMLLDFGSDLIRFIGRNSVAPIVTKVYREAFTAIRKWEPEFRPEQVQLLHLDKIGGLGLGMRGGYYPEGRLGNYALRIDKDAAFSLRAAESFGRGTA